MCGFVLSIKIFIMELLVSSKGAAIAARQSGSTSPVSENSPELTKGKVIGLAEFRPKGYPSSTRLVVEVDGKKFKCSNWEETSPEANIWLVRQSADLEDGKTIYWYVGVNQAPKGE
jgi:hypothetical protein